MIVSSNTNWQSSIWRAIKIWKKEKEKIDVWPRPDSKKQKQQDRLTAVAMGALVVVWLIATSINLKATNADANTTHA